MSTTMRWILGILAAVLIVSLLVWARGTTHQRGEDVGSLGVVAVGSWSS